MAEERESPFSTGAGRGPVFAVPWYPFFTADEYRAGLSLLVDDADAERLAQQLAGETVDAPGDAGGGSRDAASPGAAPGGRPGVGLTEVTLVAMSLVSPRLGARVEEYYRSFGIPKGPGWSTRRAQLLAELTEQGLLP
jgi:hypothetical protein